MSSLPRVHKLDPGRNVVLPIIRDEWHAHMKIERLRERERATAISLMYSDRTAPRQVPHEKSPKPSAETLLWEYAKRQDDHPDWERWMLRTILPAWEPTEFTFVKRDKTVWGPPWDPRDEQLRIQLHFEGLDVEVNAEVSECGFVLRGGFATPLNWAEDDVENFPPAYRRRLAPITFYGCPVRWTGAGGTLSVLTVTVPGFLVTAKMAKRLRLFVRTLRGTGMSWNTDPPHTPPLPPLGFE